MQTFWPRLCSFHRLAAKKEDAVFRLLWRLPARTKKTGTFSPSKKNRKIFSSFQKERDLLPSKKD
jgi:hypothetical protein